MILVRLLPLAAACVPLFAAASCGSAFCAINTQWDTQGMTTEAGRLSLDLRYEYIAQDRLRQGSRDIAASEDAGDAAELQTLNRNLVATMDYALDRRWGVSASIPAEKRTHWHIADPAGAAAFESWDFAQLGDARIVGRYQFDAGGAGGHPGIQFGLKLPTGRHDIVNAQGIAAERALQPGTGSTDLLLGAYYAFRPQYRDLGWFVQGQYQRAVATRDGFRPGDQLALTGGINYPLGDDATLLFQLNGLVRQRDTGTNAEPALSGGRFLFASPGISLPLGHDAQFYAFLQAPVVQNVNGIQLVARRSVVAGFSKRF